jgi:predicted DNA-binding ribbon-helix-helix protein
MATIQNSLISKNVTVNELRISLRLDRASWLALEDICQFETLPLHELCMLVVR